MSSLIFHVEESQVFVATDTLATSLDGRPSQFTTKAFLVPHLRMILAATGAGGFLSRWFLHINDGMVVRGIDLLDHHAPRNLAAIWRGYKDRFPLSFDASVTVYHFGFSEVTRIIHAFAYRSTNNFRSERLAYGLSVKPECTIPNPYCLPQDIKTMMNDQRTIQASRPRDQRIYIGGEMEVHHLSNNGFHVFTIGRFDDYDSDEAAIYENFEVAQDRE